MNEPNLIQQLQLQKPGAYEALVHAFKDRVFNTALGFLPNRGDAEDICQEVFVEVFLSVSKFREDSSLSTWIYRITTNKCLETLRSRKRKKRAGKLLSLFGDQGELRHDPAEFDHPGILLERKDQAETLFRFLHTLNDNQRTALTLYHFQGLTYQEIAEVMESSLAAVESWIHRGKKKLRIRLEAFYQKESR